MSLAPPLGQTVVPIPSIPARYMDPTSAADHLLGMDRADIHPQAQSMISLPRQACLITPWTTAWTLVSLPTSQSNKTTRLDRSDGRRTETNLMAPINSYSARPRTLLLCRRENSRICQPTFTSRNKITFLTRLMTGCRNAPMISWPSTSFQSHLLKT